MFKKKEPKEKPEKTPMQQAMNQIKTAYGAAFFSAVLTFIFVIVSIWTEVFPGLNIFAIVDVALVFILGVLLVTIKSRVAAIILLVHYIFSQISMRIGNPELGAGNIAMVIVFVGAYFSGIIGTFNYHKLRKEEKNAAGDNSANTQ